MKKYTRSNIPGTRIRRGKLVVIPEEWRFNVTTQKTIRQRPSKLHGKLKRTMKSRTGNTQYKDRKDEPLD